MDSSIDELLRWASSKNITLNGIVPKPLPGRGIGIVTTRALKPGEVVLTVPTQTLRTISNTPTAIKTALKGATVHAILACSLCLDFTTPSQDFLPWRAVFPSRRDVTISMPLSWPSELHDLLPQRAKGLLDKQKKKFETDWGLVTKAYPRTERDDYLYAWLLVNTRTFYHKTPKTDKLPREDHMVLQPVADLLNHSPTRGCSVDYTAASFTITTKVPHEPGDEVFIQYGPHANDFLLVEYGFTLDHPLNPFDETCLDEYICPTIGSAKKKILQEAGFWKRYMLDADTACYRTQVALRVQILPDHQWKDFLDGLRDEEEDQRQVDKQLLKVLSKYEKDVHEVLATLDASSIGEDVMRKSIRDRWIQIKQLIVMTTHRLSG